MKKKNLLLILSLMLLISLACMESSAPQTEAPNTNIIATSVALTVEAGGQLPPTVAELPSPLPTMTPAIPPTITFTPTIVLTATPSIPMVSVSEDTNCRTGPGKVYDRIGALMTNEKAEIVGKNTPSDYWIIKNPDANGNCWLWGFYATVAGNTDNIQEYAVPPTPTPAPPVAPSNLVVTAKSCMADLAPHYNITINLTWVDNSNNEDFFSIYHDNVWIFDIPADQNFTGDFTELVTDSVPGEFKVTASNTTGESAPAVVQAVCP